MSDRRNELMDQNLISVGSGQLSLPNLFYAKSFYVYWSFNNPPSDPGFPVLWFNRMRVKSAVMQSS